MQENKIIIDDLNIYLSDLHVLYAKLHNFHWNVVGTSFFTLHAKLEELYNAVAEHIDEVAERIIMLNGTPLGTLKDYLSHATLSESENVEIAGKDAIGKLLEDFKVLLANVQKIREQAEVNKEPITVAKMDAAIENYEKNIWMLSAYLK